MKLKSIGFLFLLGVVGVSMASAQAGVSQKQVDTIKNALQRIAISNNAVENIIYDGMTYDEVLQILNARSLGILWEVENDNNEVYTLYYSVVGRYRIYWSAQSVFQDPIVTGFSLATDHNIRHNQLR